MALAVVVGEREALEVKETDALIDVDALKLGVGDGETVGELLSEGDALAVAATEELIDVVPLMDIVEDLDALVELLMEMDAVVLCDHVGLTLGVGVAVPATERVVVPVDVTTLVTEAVVDGLELCDVEGVPLALCDADAVGVLEVVRVKVLLDVIEGL